MKEEKKHILFSYSLFFNMPSMCYPSVSSVYPCCQRGSLGSSMESSYMANKKATNLAPSTDHGRGGSTSKSRG